MSVAWTFSESMKMISKHLFPLWGMNGGGALVGSIILYVFRVLGRLGIMSDGFTQLRKTYNFYSTDIQSLIVLNR